MALTLYWHQIHRWPRVARWPLKLAVFALATALVLYPQFWLVPVCIQRLRDLDAVVDPTCPALAPLEAEVVAAAGPHASLPELAGPVEYVVDEHILYAYDWETWGVLDYLPTVAEALAAGREDCDGRAVVAASLLRRLGYDARLVCDLKHMWVVAQDETTGAAPIELMGPGAGEKTLTGGKTGTSATWSLAAARNLTRGLTFGIAVFPFGRELLIVAALCAVTLQPRSSLARRAVGCTLLLGALLLLRAAGPAVDAIAQRPVLVWIGGALAVAGWLLLALKSRRAPARSAERILPGRVR